MKYFSSRICNFYMQKLSTAAAKILLKKRRNYVKLTFFTYNIKKTKIYFLESQFLIPKF
jgi:hypothetical protein